MRKYGSTKGTKAKMGLLAKQRAENVVCCCINLQECSSKLNTKPDFTLLVILVF